MRQQFAQTMDEPHQMQPGLVWEGQSAQLSNLQSNTGTWQPE
jgi:hypothetical protein